MRDLIDRAELLAWMEAIAANLNDAEDVSDSYVNGYRSAMHDVKMAAWVKAAKPANASDVEEYALNMKAVAEGLLREIPYGVSDTADDCHASAEAMLEETKQFLAKMGVKEHA